MVDASMSNNDEAELLERIRNGASDDFAEIIQRHRNHVFAILARYERDAHRLEDLAQETFVKAWKALAQYDGRAPFQHWLSRIAVHAALDHLRKQKRNRNEIGFPELGEDVLEWLHNDDEDRQLEAESARELLDTAMRQLSPTNRLVITMLEIEGRSVKEISAVTGWSSIAVRVRGVRARAKLKKALEQLAEREKAKEKRQ